MGKKRGRVTLPAEAGFEKESIELFERWGADAIRDCDGTELSEDLLRLDAKVYKKYFVCRGHNDWVKENMDQVQQIYLLSNYILATSTELEIPFMEGYFRKQIRPDYNHDPKKWWEVIDRTTGEVV
ncbi:MAG: 1,3-beta-galactosyl-N-acetylhexosamine phosphorylase, partial [Firmicutes bacterium]|nr:1,3-beta-galactosyl-N-acetylhexosamine phosphorylase [Bacillota bacterium]